VHHPLLRPLMFGLTALALSASTAEAAKGVKKNLPAGGAHEFSGEITHVNHKGGEFHLRTAHSHKKVGANAGRNQGHEFRVTSATRFEGAGGGHAGLVALHGGERARVRAIGTNAERVHILSHHRSHGSFYRHRPYRGIVHYHQHHARAHHHKR